MSRHPRSRLARASIVLLLPVALAAQEPSKPWSVEEIHGPARKVAFTVDEGTWMSLDVSPDGQTIVFDLLGDLYTIPIAGGKANRLTSGTRWDAAPRYSPDGSTILFDSDPSGSDQLWTMPARGGAPTRITTDGQYQYLQGSWDPERQLRLRAPPDQAVPADRIRDASRGRRHGDARRRHRRGEPGRFRRRPMAVSRESARRRVGGEPDRPDRPANRRATGDRHRL